MDVQVPFNTVSTVYVPAVEPGDVTEGGKPLVLVEGIQVSGVENGYVILRVGSGSGILSQKSGLRNMKMN